MTSIIIIGAIFKPDGTIINLDHTFHFDENIADEINAQLDKILVSFEK